MRLFRRAAKDRMVLTPHGRALHDVVAPFLESLRVTVDALRAGSFGGVPRVGAAALLVQELLPGWLRAPHRRHAEVDVTLTELRAPDVTLLRTGELDLLVDYLPEIPPRRRGAGGRQGLGLPGAPGQPSRPRGRRGWIAPAHRASVPHLRCRPGEPRAATEGGGGAGASARERFAADSTASLLGFVAAGLGFSVVPALHPRGPRRAGIRAIRLRLPGSELPVHAAWLRGVPNPMLAAALDVAPSSRA